MLSQGGQGGLNLPSVVPQGGSITVDVGPNDTSIEVKEALSGEITSYPVSPGKSVTIPVPALPPGAFFSVTIADGKRKRSQLVEVIAPSP